MKITNIEFYDEEVEEAFEITIESNGKTKIFNIRPSDDGFKIYDNCNELMNEIKINQIKKDYQRF